MLPRPRHLESVLRSLSAFPVVAILGPRQVGKTTLARELQRDVIHAGDRAWRMADRIFAVPLARIADIPR